MGEVSGLGEVAFEALLEPMEWGRSVYVVVRVPAELVESAQAWPTHRVEGRVDDLFVNVGLQRAPADVMDGHFFYVGAGMRRRLGLRPGDVVACRLRPADPDAVPLPDDVRSALQESGALDAFEARTPAERRRLLVPVEAAVRPDTRARRIAALLEAIESV